MVTAQSRLQAEGSSAHEMVDGMHGGLADDLNTSRVLSALSEPLKQVNDFCHTKQVILPINPANNLQQGALP